MHFSRFRVFMATVLLALLVAPGATVAQKDGHSLLAQAEVERLFPASVYYCGQSAPVQVRNSGGVKFADGHYVLASMVDTSGYSTGLAAKYQGYLLSEVPLKIGGKTLQPGAYGFGFVAGDKFLITDLGGAEVLSVATTSDAALQRPRPLQLVNDPVGGFRLYAGHNFVHLIR